MRGDFIRVWSTPKKWLNRRRRVNITPKYLMTLATRAKVLEVTLERRPKGWADLVRVLNFMKIRTTTGKKWTSTTIRHIIHTMPSEDRTAVFKTFESSQRQRIEENKDRIRIKRETEKTHKKEATIALSEFKKKLARIHNLYKRRILIANTYNEGILTLKQLGDVIGVTRERIRQITVRHNQKIRDQSEFQSTSENLDRLKSDLERWKTRKQEQVWIPDIFYIEIKDIKWMLSKRVINCLSNHNILRLGDLASVNEIQFIRAPNLGRWSLNEIEKTLEKFNLTLGMDIPGWKSTATSPPLVRPRTVRPRSPPRRQTYRTFSFDE